MAQAGTDVHEHWMRRCLTLAGRGAGRVSPNPLVGAVLVDPAGHALGEGWHEVYGGLHAERNAVADVEQRHGPEVLRTATLYVNLEPCNHYGKTPPCTEIVLEKGIPRVVVGMVDPFPQVAGRGIARLREHGVEVVTGVLERECRRLNEAFVHHIATGRPLVTLKVAQTLDGRVATAGAGTTRWISGEASRRLVHVWRSELDGVLVGAGTAIADDPALTVRAVEGRQPVRIVLDRTGALSPGLKLFSDDHAGRSIAVIGKRAAPAYEGMLVRAGGRVVRCPEQDGHLDLHAVLDWLGREGGRDGLPMQSLLVEAGPGLSSALFQRDLVDRYFLFIAPRLAGDGVPGLNLSGAERLADGRSFAASEWEQVGEDMLFKGYRRPV